MRSSSNCRGLTPIQCQRRMYGEFKCPECNRQWMSGNTWAGLGQESKFCKINVNPHFQAPLESADSTNRNKSDLNKPHHKDDKCEKCKQLGFSCQMIREDSEGSCFTRTTRTRVSAFDICTSSLDHDVQQTLLQRNQCRSVVTYGSLSYAQVVSNSSTSTKIAAHKTSLPHTSVSVKENKERNTGHVYPVVHPVQENNKERNTRRVYPIVHPRNVEGDINKLALVVFAIIIVCYIIVNASYNKGFKW